MTISTRPLGLTCYRLHSTATVSFNIGKNLPEGPTQKKKGNMVLQFKSSIKKFTQAPRIMVKYA